uniref:Uncharacterized protein n=1 Tax=Rhizophora mucronata TaxID=61149 RepID=A0A2P2NBZ4_RHIMU
MVQMTRKLWTSCVEWTTKNCFHINFVLSWNIMRLKLHLLLVA